MQDLSRCPGLFRVLLLGLVVACGSDRAQEPADLAIDSSPVNNPYGADEQINLRFTAHGGMPPYVWTRADGFLLGTLTLDPSGILTGSAQTANIVSFTLRVTDASGATAQKPIALQFELSPGVSPAITTESLPRADINQAYTATFSATGVTPPLLWSVLPFGYSLPPGMTFDPSGVISGVPAYPAGSYILAVSVSGSQAAEEATRSFRFTVRAPGGLTIVTSEFPPLQYGSPLDFTAEATGGTPPYIWSVSPFGPLPDGLVISASGAVSGTPQALGLDTVRLHVEDGVGATAIADLMIEIRPAPVVITNTSFPDATLGGLYREDLHATGGGFRYKWQVVAGQLPPGLQANDGGMATSGYIGGTPIALGTYTFTLQARSFYDTLTDTHQFSITVLGPPPTVATASLPDGRQNQAYSVFLVANGGVGPLTWSIAGGTLPPGITLSAAGELAGSPSSTGIFAFTVRVLSADGQSATGDLQLQILS